MSDPDLAGLKSGEGWLYASSLPLGNGDPGRFHALFGRDSLISAGSQLGCLLWADAGRRRPSRQRSDAPACSRRSSGSARRLSCTRSPAPSTAPEGLVQQGRRDSHDPQDPYGGGILHPTALRARISSTFGPDVMALEPDGSEVRGAGSQLGWLLWAGALESIALSNRRQAWTAGARWALANRWDGRRRWSAHAA